MATDAAVIPINSAQRVAMAPFDLWTYEDAVREAKLALPKEYQTKKAYGIDKDHYRQGREWVGPGDAIRNPKIGVQFAPEDAVGEVAANVGNAFTEPQIGAQPLIPLRPGEAMPAELQAKIDLSLELINWWFDKRKVQDVIQTVQERGVIFGRAALRWWIPPRFLLNNNGVLEVADPGNDWYRALSYIHLITPLPESGIVLTDPNTMDQVCVYFDEEVKFDGNGGKRVYKRAELVYLDPNRDNDEDANTVIRVVYADRRSPLRVTLPLRGGMSMHEIETRSLFTDPVIRTQRQLNLLTTLITRMAETAAFRERYIKNAKPQGTRRPYEEGDVIPNGGFLETDEGSRVWVVVPEERTLGANTVTELVGLPSTDDRGEVKGHANTDVQVIDPVDPKPYLEAADSTRRRVLRMCGQGHLGGISNAEASGIAYEQARAVFEKDLNKRRVAEEAMLRGLFTSVLAMAEYIMGQEGYFTEAIRITVDQHVNAGPRSPDLVRLDMEAYEGGVLSWETTATKLGVEDIAAERERVRRSAAHIMELLEKVTASSNAFTPESLIEVLRQLNVPKEIVDQLEAKEEPEPAPAVPPQV